MTVPTTTPGGPEVRLAHLPERVAQLLHEGRQRLWRSRESVLALNLSLRQAEEALAACNWQELLLALEQMVPPDLLPFIDREQPADFRGIVGAESVDVTVRMPGLSPIAFPVRWADGAWQRAVYAAFEESYAWRVVCWVAPDRPSEESDYTNTFSMALALAEEAEQQRHALPRRQSHGLAPAPGHGEVTCS